jgi:hypothetical protein
MMDTEVYKRGPGRPAKPGGMDTWKIYIPMEVSHFFRSILTNPDTGRIPQGDLSGLCERLLRDEMARIRQAHQVQQGVKQ